MSKQDFKSKFQTIGVEWQTNNIFEAFYTCPFCREKDTIQHKRKEVGVKNKDYKKKKKMEQNFLGIGRNVLKAKLFYAQNKYM